MKIILLEDFDGLGYTGDIVDVKPGYANNYLLKKNRAVRATKENLAKAEEIRLEAAKKNAENKQAAESLAEVLNETEIKIPAKAGSEGRLFGSITNRDIAQALLDQKEINVDKKKIVMNEPIKALGENELKIHLYPEIEATIKVNVVPE